MKMENGKTGLDWRRIFEEVTGQLQEVVVVTDANLEDEGPHIQQVNEPFNEMFGYSKSEIIGRPLSLLWNYKERQKLVADLRSRLDNSKGTARPLMLYDDNRNMQWLNSRYYPIKDETGNLINIVFLFTPLKDNGDKKQLQYMAYYDSLTGLPNRQLFDDRLRQAVDRAGRSSEKLAVLFVDLDGFKKVNDELGHQLGDHFLKVLAQRMLGSIRKSDTVARIGGDEFAFLFTDIHNKSDVYSLADKVKRELSKEIVLGEMESWSVGASIGVALYPRDGDTANALLERADHAMYRGKSCGGGDIDFYSADGVLFDSRASKMRNKFIEALDKNEFKVYLQPEVDVVSGKVLCFEALLRWQQPAEGLLLPADFLPRAEMVGMLSKIEEMVLAKVCHRISRWKKMYADPPAISINLSGESLLHREMMEMVPRIVTRSGTNPGFLQIELSETDALRDMDFTLAEFKRLNELGIRTCLDDFGSHLSSLKHVDIFPVDKIKLSAGLVKEIPDEQNANIIAENIIKTAREIDREVIPVGVENPQQLNFFEKAGCTTMQGNLFATARRHREIEQKPAEPKLNLAGVK
ncbi:MAG: EAL domain-containing protein [bacterium]